MRTNFALTIATMLLTALAAAEQLQVQSPNAGSAGSQYFDQADQALSAKHVGDMLPLVEKGWAAVKAAGPRDSGFLLGVYSAARLFRVLAHDLEAESVYNEAILSCGPTELARKRSSLTYMLAQDLVWTGEYVKAESVLRAGMAEAESSAVKKNPLYVAFLQTLAFVREQEGDLADAESILRSALAYDAPDLSGVVLRNFWISPGPPLPGIGYPREMLAVFYWNHARLPEAEQIFRDQVARTEGEANQHLSALRQLATFLSTFGSKLEAVALQKQIVAHVKAQVPSSFEITSEESTLARYQVHAGQGEEARQMLESNLLQAQTTKGAGSPEYWRVFNDLFENRLSVQDYDEAEKLARQQLQNVQQRDDPEPAPISSALSQLAQVRRAQGHTSEAEELEKRAAGTLQKLNHGPWTELEERFRAAEKMIQGDDPARALAEIERMANAYHFEPYELFNFERIAQSFATARRRPEALRVAAIASSILERAGLDVDPRFASSLVDWAGFYRSHLGVPATAGVFLQKAEELIQNYCGEQSPKMESVLRERAWLNENPSARIAALGKLLDFEISVFGANNRRVEDTTLEIARLHRSSGEWAQAISFYEKALTIGKLRTGGGGGDYLQLLSRVSMEFFTQGEYQTALELNVRASKICSGFLLAEQMRIGLEAQHREIEMEIARAASR
jgi:tetratricopeptide (TPR) repeat protein